MPVTYDNLNWFSMERVRELSYGLLYCVASLVLGIELNIVGPTADSLAAQVGVRESALGGVVGLGGIGLLLGGIPSGWLLDKLPGHSVLASAAALQAATFCLLPHSATLTSLAVTYGAAALTFNAITTSANALILWRYPASQGAWLNLASALFGVGCFLAPVLADVAGRHTAATGGQLGLGLGAATEGAGWGNNGDAVGWGEEGGKGAGGANAFVARAGGSALAYYIVAAGAAACALWAACLPSPQRPADHHSHANTTPATATTQPQVREVRQRRRASEADGSDVGEGSSSIPHPTLLPALPSPLTLLADGEFPTPANTDNTNYCCCMAGTNTLRNGNSISNVSSPSGGVSGSGGYGIAGGAFGSTLSYETSEAGSGGGAGLPDGVFRKSSASDVLSAAASQIQHQLARQGGGPQEGATVVVVGCGETPGEKGGTTATATPAVAVAVATGTNTEVAAVATPAGGGGGVAGAGGGLFHRYMHELRMGWPVLLPVVLLLFANVSTQASFGAWVTTYCRRAAGLDEASAQAVTAAYWAAFTGTRLVGVAAAPFLHASSVLLITSPFAVAGAALAVMGLPQIPWILPAASAPAAAAAFAASLPLWALYGVVCLVGVGVATGFANTVSLTGDHLRLDGFTNGILSSVAGLASTLCPSAVPWLAGHTQLGYGALMAVTLAMSVVQLGMVGCALVGATWVDEWQRREEAEEGAEEVLKAEEEEGGRQRVVVRVVEADGGGKADGGIGGELRVPLLVRDGVQD